VGLFRRTRQARGLAGRRHHRKETLSVASGWHAHLDMLDDVLHQHKPRGFWTRHAELEKAYQAQLPA